MIPTSFPAFVIGIFVGAVLCAIAVWMIAPGDQVRGDAVKYGHGTYTTTVNEAGTPSHTWRWKDCKGVEE